MRTSKNVGGGFRGNVQWNRKKLYQHQNSLFRGGPKRSNIAFSGCRNSTWRSRHLAARNTMRERHSAPLLRDLSTHKDRSSLWKRSFSTPTMSPYLFSITKPIRSLIKVSSNYFMTQSPDSYNTDNSCKFISHLLHLVPWAGGWPSSTLRTGGNHHHPGSLKR